MGMMTETPEHTTPSSPRPAPTTQGRAGAGKGAVPTGTAPVGTTPDSTAPRSRTTVERPTVRITLPDGWARSGLAGIEAALIGWGLLMVLTLVGYLSVSGNPWLGKATWSDAVAVGGDLWGAALGAPVHVGGTTLRAIPTLLTLLVLVVLRVLLLGGRGYPAAAQWSAVPTFAITALVLLGTTAGHVWVPAALPGALLVPALAALWALVSQTDTAPGWAARVPWVWEGLRQARLVVGVLALIGAVAVGVSLHASWEQVTGIHELLLADTTDTVVIIIAQALFAPTAMAWALSWLAGPGFWVGSDTLHAPGTAPVAPIPAIPLLGAVPATAPGNRVAVVLVGVGVLLGLWLRWRRPARDLASLARSGAACAAGVLVVMAAWFALSTLQLGQGRMSLLGPRVVWSAGMVVLEVVVTAQVVAALVHPRTVAWTGERIAALRTRLAERRAARSATGAAAAPGTGGAARTPSHGVPGRGHGPDDTPTTALDIDPDTGESAGSGASSAPEAASTVHPGNRADSRAEGPGHAADGSDPADNRPGPAASAAHGDAGRAAGVPAAAPPQTARTTAAPTTDATDGATDPEETP